MQTPFSDKELAVMSDYARIAMAIDYLHRHAERQPLLGEIAAHVNLSPAHLQRTFSRWAGVSPKRLLQVLTLEQGKRLLRPAGTVLDAAERIGLSSGSRLYDHFVQLEAVTPGEYQRLGDGLCIEYGSHESPFGPMFVAFSPRGVCRAAFLEFTSLTAQLALLRRDWPRAELRLQQDAAARMVETMFARLDEARTPLSLHVQGTNFQIAVWRALLHIPVGRLMHYGQLAAALQRPRAARAVGNAIAANPVAFLIPCHRVIRQTGAVGKYHWGSTRKKLLQLWERAQVQDLPDSSV